MNRINLIALGVKDIGKAMKFYKEIGFKTYEEADNPPIVFFDNDGTKLELFSLKALAKEINPTNPPVINTGFSGITLAINFKTKVEVDEFVKLVESAGGPIAKYPEPTNWGGYSGYFQDIDGYYWEVAYGDSWKFDDNNMLVIE